jgi:putative selenate reductase
MADTLFPLPLESLAGWILAEEKRGSILGIGKGLFFRPAGGQPFRSRRYGRLLETPLGVAAGPHTQLAQNIVAAYLCGARYIELKTVQTVDDLTVPKPCIDMEDEGYNCEWSQELTLDQAFDQYLDAWLLIHLLQHKLNGAAGGEPGFIFNMSVGYNLAGIMKANVQRFLERMADCRAEKERKIEMLSRLYPEIKDIAIPDTIADNITLSTMHGCPPQEIESIALYLMGERRLHTTIKLNPTLLGPEGLRDILNRRLGFDVTVPDRAFDHDLKYEEAVALIRRLQEEARQNDVHFGLKLTNTLECLNRRAVLPQGEEVIYLSGRALHPLAVNLAYRLQREFGGRLDLSFAGGADCFNIVDLLACGLQPVTVCSDLLKPGGYGRLPQYLEELAGAMERADAGSIDAFIHRRGSPGGRHASRQDRAEAALANLEQYAAAVVEDRLYHKAFYPERNIKGRRKLSYFDCIEAPCLGACAADQGVPEYMYYTARGDYAGALGIILEQNPLPAITGMVCDHLCQSKCTRLHYDNPLQIRSIKRFIESRQPSAALPAGAKKNGLKAAVIGAGPSGLACAYFLALSGFEVAVYEAGDFPGGLAAGVIPGFRITAEDIRRDVERIRGLGVRFHFNVEIDKKRFEQLRHRCDYLYLAVGARRDKRLHIPGEEIPGVMGALDFLSRLRRNRRLDTGKRVAIIGGGNSAVDAARTAWRLVGDDGEVSILYRRTTREMPADREELEAVTTEGIGIRELTAAEEIRPHDGSLRLWCCRTRLAEPDESGRGRPVKVEGSRFRLDVDTLISAVGQEVVLDFLPDIDLKPDPETGKTALENVWIGGDARRGPASVVLAIGDGKGAARQMMQAAGLKAGVLSTGVDKGLDFFEYQERSARRVYGEEPPVLPLGQRKNFERVIKDFSEEAARKEATRCLYCGDICNVCVTVCPNRALVSFRVEPVNCRLQKVYRQGGTVKTEGAGEYRLEQVYQVFNIADFCNECGNCRTFCPTDGAPYKDKPKLCLTAKSFAAEPEGYLLGRQAGRLFIKTRRRGLRESLALMDDGFIYETAAVSVRLAREDFALLDVQFKSPASPETEEIDLRPAADMGVMLGGISTSCPYLLAIESGERSR